MIVKTGFTIYLLNAISTSYIYTIIVEQAVSRAVFGANFLVWVRHLSSRIET